MVTDFIFIILWISFPIFWISLLKICQPKVLYVSLLSALIFFILIFSYLGFPIVYFQLDEFRTGEIQDQQIIMEAFLYSGASTSLLILGAVFSSIIFGRLKLWEFEQLSANQSHATFLLISVIFLCSCYVLYMYISQIGITQIAGLVAFGFFESDSSINFLRSNMTNSFEGSYFFYQLMFEELLLFVTLISFALNPKRSALIWPFRILVFLVCMFTLLMSAQKAPIMELFFGLIMIFSLKQLSGVLPSKLILLSSPIIVVLLVLFYQTFTEFDSFLSSFAGVLSRTFTGPIEAIYVYLSYFPEYSDFLGGASFPNPRGIFPYEPVTITQEIMAWYNPNEAKLGIVGSIPAIYWVEAYANFGLGGVILVSFSVGFLLHALNLILMSFKNDPISSSFFVWLALFYKDLSQTFFSNYIYSGHLLLTFFVFIIITLIVNKGKIYFRQNQA